MATIVLIEDHPIYRDGLKTNIMEAFEIVGEAGMAAEGLRLVIDKSPDIALVDLKLPDYDGFRLTKEITGMTSTKVMIISNHSRIGFVKQAVRAGAMGYITKESGKECVIKGLNMVKKGQKFIDNSLSNRMCDYFFHNEGLEARLIMYEKLSEREQSIVGLLIKDFTPKEIAFELDINEKTVSYHKKRIMKKLNLKGKGDLIKFAIDIGLIV